MKTTSFRQLILLSQLLLLTLVSSCTTTPYTRYLSPSISGQIRINGEPASQVNVLMSISGGDTSCVKSLRQTQTDIEGNFSLSSARDHMSYTPLMTHYLDEWNVCVDIQGHRVNIHSDNRYGIGSVTGSVNIQCNFTKDQFSASNCHLAQ